MTSVVHQRASLLVERIRNEVARRLLECAFVVAADRPVPAVAIVALSHVAGSRNALSDWFLARPPDLEPIVNTRAAETLRGSGNEGFAIGADSLNFLDRTIRRLRPRAVLEFGSGQSTVVLAAALADLHGETGPAHLFSIDESPEWLEETRNLLARAGLSGRVKLAHLQLRDWLLDGHESRCYDLSDEFLDTFLDARPELVLIDGPSGGGYARLATLPLVAPRLSRPCTFLLDDALRTDEVRVAAAWRDLPGVKLRGIHPTGHGLLEGRLA